MKKRFLSVLLCLIMALGLLPTAAFAEDTEPLTITSVDVQIAVPKVGDTVSREPDYKSMTGNSAEQSSDVSSSTVYWERLPEVSYDSNYSLENQDKGKLKGVLDGATFEAGYYYRFVCFAKPSGQHKFTNYTKITLNGKTPIHGTAEVTNSDQIKVTEWFHLPANVQPEKIKITEFIAVVPPRWPAQRRTRS